MHNYIDNYNSNLTIKKFKNKIAIKLNIIADDIDTYPSQNTPTCRTSFV